MPSLITGEGIAIDGGRQNLGELISISPAFHKLFKMRATLDSVFAIQGNIAASS